MSCMASLRHSHLGSFFLDPEDIRKLSIGAMVNAWFMLNVLFEQKRKRIKL
jgi:hypothetical protein